MTPWSDRTYKIGFALCLALVLIGGVLMQIGGR